MHLEECIESTICVWLGVGLLYQMWTLLEAILLKQRSWPSTPIQVFILITKKTHKTSQKFNQLCSTELDCVPGDSTSQASAKDGDQVIALFSQSAKFLQSGAKFTNFFSSTPKSSHGSSSWKHLNRYMMMIHCNTLRTVDSWFFRSVCLCRSSCIMSTKLRKKSAKGFPKSTSSQTCPDPCKSIWPPGARVCGPIVHFSLIGHRPRHTFSVALTRPVAWQFLKAMADLIVLLMILAMV